MGALAAHLVDGVLRGLPVRQWVLTLRHRLRYALAYDHRLCPAVLGVFVRAVLAFERRRAERQGIRGRAGAVTAIQRCGSALNTNVHFHTLVAEGVFEDEPAGCSGSSARRRRPTSRWRVCCLRCGGASSASCAATASSWRGGRRPRPSAWPIAGALGPVATLYDGPRAPALWA